MNVTSLLVEQLMVAIVASTIIVPTIQKAKGWMPNGRFVEPVSVIISFLLGFAIAIYYNGFDYIASAWVGFYSVIGAELIYNLLSEKLKTYTEKKEDLIIKPIAKTEVDNENGIG